jgi:hypothetical protein
MALSDRAEKALMTRLRILGVLLLVAALAGLPDAPRLWAGQQLQWWDARWRYRLTVQVVEPSLRAGINTAQLDLAEQGQLCRPDGRDVRVMTADPGVEERPVPHRVEARDGRTLDVLFEVPADCSRFNVYYGNPDAEAAEGQWTESLGGLFLATLPIDQPIWQPGELPRAVGRYSSRLDYKPWGRIWDLENPFGRDDLYLSVYRGTLYCPETGRYTFAVNADDLAVFSIEELADPLCWRGPGTPSMTWQDPVNPRAVRKLPVKKGVYHIVYCHAESYGAQLAELGWQTPSSDDIVTVPSGAFVRYLPAEVVSRESAEQGLCPFFVALHRYNLKVNGLEAGFPAYRLESRMPEGRAEGLEFHWDFGDGTTAAGSAVEHEFGQAPSHDVTLTVRDAAGAQASVTRPIAAPPDPVKDVTLRLQVHGKEALIGRGAPLRLRVVAVADGASGLTFELVSAATDGTGPERRGRVTSHSLQFGPAAGGRGSPAASEETVELEEDYPSEEGDARVSVRALLHGTEVAREQVIVTSTDGPLYAMRLDEAQNLRDEDGALVVLRLADVTRAKAAPRRLCEARTGTVSVLVLDEMLAGPAGRPERSEHASVLADLLSARYPELKFALQRVGAQGTAESSPMEELLGLCRMLTRARPNLVLLVCQPQSVINGVPVEDFEKVLSASLDQVLARTRAEAIVVAPPPIPDRPEMARPYESAAKRVGLRKGVPVVDLYSRFLLMEDWQALFRPLGSQSPALCLYPNAVGQEGIAREVYATAVENFHEEFSAAVRQMALLPGAPAGR